jgi:glycosyltransferase involved in cell wall biosynthesis
MHRRAIDVLIDLSGTGAPAEVIAETIRALAEPESLGALGGTVTGVVDEGLTAGTSGAPRSWRWVRVSGSSITAATTALDGAARASRPLLVVLDPLVVSRDAVGLLSLTLPDDPFNGIGVPRVADRAGNLAPLIPFEDAPPAPLPRSVQASIPGTYRFAELVAPCFLIRREVVAALGGLDPSFLTVEGSWLHYLARARRLGFRCLIVNRAVITPVDRAARRRVTVAWDPGPEDAARLSAIFPETARALDAVRRHPAPLHERLLASSRPATAGGRRPLLLDGRSLDLRFNGTVEAMLGLAEGIRDANDTWEVTFLARQEAQQFHGLAARFPGWRLAERPDEGAFAAALFMSQPWHIETMATLHRRALVNAYLVLDTIADDVLYCSPPGLHGTWSFLAEHADGLVFISGFSRDRFATRFPESRGTPATVSYLSLHPGDYIRSEAVRTSSEGWLLVVGNDLDHKYVAPALDRLATAFPFRPIRVLGHAGGRWANVEGVASGEVSAEEVDRFFAGALAVVFPSYYEGFGFPLVRGLSFGRTVVARAGPLLDEIASCYRGPGRLLSFESDAELVEGVGAALYEPDRPGLPLGTALPVGQEPRRWTDVARHVLHFLEGLVDTHDASRWMARARHLEQIDAFTR